MGYRSSGNLTVDAMGSIAISGNVIPEEWYKHILKPTTESLICWQLLY